MDTEPDVLLTWINALTQLPDLKPFVELLRSGRPMPWQICDLLAELLNPGDPDIMGGRLIYKPTRGIEKLVGKTEIDRKTEEIKKEVGGELQAVFDYHELIKSGESSQDAAAGAGEKAGIDARTVYRYVKGKRLAAIGARLRGK